jgi:hypothetical protein
MYFAAIQKVARLGAFGKKKTGKTMGYRKKPARMKITQAANWTHPR